METDTNESIIHNKTHPVTETKGFSKEYKSLTIECKSNVFVIDEHFSCGIIFIFFIFMIYMIIIFYFISFCCVAYSKFAKDKVNKLC